MNCLAGEGFFERAKCFTCNPVEMCFQQLSRFPDVAEKESERSLAIDLLLRFVRNVFVHDAAVEGESWYHYRTGNEVMICIINMLEIRETYSDEFVVGRRAAKMGDRFAVGNRRDLVKFVAKRLPCSCMKKLHRATRKKVAKLGMCAGCTKRFPRWQLFVCTGCMINEYCSPACQRADWSHHKQHCGHPELISRDLPADYVFKSNRLSDG